MLEAEHAGASASTRLMLETSVRWLHQPLLENETGYTYCRQHKICTRRTPVTFCSPDPRKRRKTQQKQNMTKQNNIASS